MASNNDPGGERRSGRMAAGAERIAPHLDRGLGVPALFAVAYSAAGASLYLSMGVVAVHARGATPIVMAAAAIFLALAAMTYTEGALMHPKRGGGGVFARFAFNEAVSFVASWAILLDYLLLVALCAVALPMYAAGIFTSAPDALSSPVEHVAAVVVVGVAAFGSLRGFKTPLRRWALVALIDIVVLMIVIVVGLVLEFSPGEAIARAELPGTFNWDELAFAGAAVVVGFLGIEAASNLAPEMPRFGAAVKRLVAVGCVVVGILYVGMSLLAVSAVPVISTPDGPRAVLDPGFVEAPVAGIVAMYSLGPLTTVLRVTVSLGGAMLLLMAANAGMMGISRLSYALATNRQIPRVLARLHPRTGAPYVGILLSAIGAGALAVLLDVESLFGVFAFGAMLSLTIAHVSICVLRFTEYDRPRPFRIPLSVRVGRGSIPLPAALGAVGSGAAWIAVMVYDEPARWVGLAWIGVGLLAYVLYRPLSGMPILGRVEVPEQALRAASDMGFGRILVPVFGTPLDDDIVGTAGRLAADRTGEDTGATIVAVYVAEVPVSLPVEAVLTAQRSAEAQRALARAREIGEEYRGVTVETEVVTARSTGEAIVDLARSRDVQAIVLGGAEPARTAGGPRLGGVRAARVPFADRVTQHVLNRAPCRIVLTAPPTAPSPGPPIAESGSP